MIRSGDLGKTTLFPDEEWTPLAAALMAGTKPRRCFTVAGFGRD